MIFNYEDYFINTKNLIRLSGLKKLNILDFGCGKGVWQEKNIEINKINKVILYDKEKKLISILKKKYRSKRIKINFSLKNILKTEHYNLVYFSSIIQYLKKNDFKSLVYKLSKNRKLVIIITDIPFLPRPFEFLALALINFKRFLFVLKIIFSKKYQNLNYYRYSKKDFDTFKKKFSVTFHKNLHDLKLLRYTVILKSN